MTYWQFWLGAGLATISVLIYYLQIVIFDNSHDTFFYLMQDLAFLPMQVLLITLLLNHVLSLREKKVLLKKMNMVIGVFFSETGIELAKYCFELDQRSEVVKNLLLVEPNWNQRKFNDATEAIKKHSFHIDARSGSLASLKSHLEDKRDFLMGLLANPNLLEHDSFTELMWAVFHLAEELGHRPSIVDLPASDYAHLSADINRVYALLVQEWLAYMSHLKNDYPYLFSLAVRTNPFNERASVIIKGTYT